MEITKPNPIKVNTPKVVMILQTGYDDSPVTPPIPPFSNTVSLDFDGVDDYVECGNVWNLSINNWSPYTLSWWFKGTNPIVGAVHLKGLFGFAIDKSGPFLYDGYLGAANLRLYMFNGVYWTVGSNGTVNLFDDQWHNCTMILPAGSNAGVDTTNAKLYIDNTLITTGTQGTATEPAAYYKWANLFIGRTNYSPIEGNLDEIALWKTDETANVEAIYNLGTPTDLSLLSTPPLHWYRNGDNDTYPTIADVGSLASNSGIMTNMSAGSIVSDVPT